MTKKLIRQIWNERRLNAGMWLELLVVSIVLWFITDSLYVTLSTYYEPLGYDISHTYRMTVEMVPEDSPEYNSSISGYDGYMKTKRRFNALVEKHPDVEALGFSERGVHYSGSRNSTVLLYDTLSSTEATEYIVSPGYVKVFRFRGAKGESSEELAELLTSQTFLAGANIFPYPQIKDTYSLVNHQFELGNEREGLLSARLAGVVQPIRRDEFVSVYNRNCIVKSYMPYHGNGTDYWESRGQMFIRAKAEADHDFINRMKVEFTKDLRGQNLMIKDFIPVSELRRNAMRDKMDGMRNQMVIMGFLMLNVFLGLLGTFWYRTQQRRGEIAVHIAMGSNRRQVLVRLLSEGLLLLLFATLPALCADYWISGTDLPQLMEGKTFLPLRFGLTAALTFVLIAVMILAGILIPALRVMKMRPAEALHNE